MCVTGRRTSRLFERREPTPNPGPGTEQEDVVGRGGLAGHVRHDDKGGLDLPHFMVQRGQNTPTLQSIVFHRRAGESMDRPPTANGVGKQFRILLDIRA